MTQARRRGARPGADAAARAGARRRRRHAALRRATSAVVPLSRAARAARRRARRSPRRPARRCSGRAAARVFAAIVVVSRARQPGAVPDARAARVLRDGAGRRRSRAAVGGSAPALRHAGARDRDPGRARLRCWSRVGTFDRSSPTSSSSRVALHRAHGGAACIGCRGRRATPYPRAGLPVTPLVFLALLAGAAGAARPEQPAAGAARRGGRARSAFRCIVSCERDAPRDRTLEES